MTALLLLAPMAGAAPVAPVPPDSAAKIVEVGRAAPAPRRGPAPVPRFDQPRWVMFRSLVVPGWGQLDNGSWFKAALVAGAEVGLGVQMVNDGRELGRLSREADMAQAAGDEDAFNAAVATYNARLAESVSRPWLLGGVLAYALLDAYVDAHFRNFRIEFDNDPALPEGTAPPGGGKLSLRWAF